jgi:hypothetical protein
MGGAFMSAGGQPKGGFDGASSIDRMSDAGDVEINLPPSENEKYLQQRVATLEDEVNQYKKQLDSARSHTSATKPAANLSTTQQPQTSTDEDLSHIKSLFM